MAMELQEPIRDSGEEADRSSETRRNKIDYRSFLKLLMSRYKIVINAFY